MASHGRFRGQEVGRGRENGECGLSEWAACETQRGCQNSEPNGRVSGAIASQPTAPNIHANGDQGRRWQSGWWFRVIAFVEFVPSAGAGPIVISRLRPRGLSVRPSGHICRSANHPSEARSSGFAVTC